MPSVLINNSTGDAYVDGILGMARWGVDTLTFSFPTDPTFYGTSYGSGENLNGFEAFTLTQQNAIRSIFDMYSSVINLNFVEITETSTQHADLRFAESDLPNTAWAYFPNTSQLAGDAWFNNSKNWYDNPDVGNFAWYTMMHEIGHTLGLKHPHSTQGWFGVMPADRDSHEYSVMSYRSFVGAGTGGVTNEAYGYPQTLMMLDIAGLQEMYGANYTTNGGATVYTWDPSTGQQFINGVGQDAPGANRIFMTIWDGGGEDTYDFGNYTTDLSVDLRPGEWTTVSTAQLANLGFGHLATGNIANALLYEGNTASLIENAIGGSGDDQIIGNVANNKLTGGAGNDVLDGDLGIDTAIYSGNWYEYQIVMNPDGAWSILDLRTGSIDGLDILIDVEFAMFSDALIELDTFVSVPAVQVPMISAYSADSGTVGDGVTNDATLTITGVAGANNTVDLYDGGTLLGSVTADAAGLWTFTTTALSDGLHNFTATAHSAGQTSASSLAVAVTVDTQPPSAPEITSYTTDTGVAGDGVTNDNTITITGTSEPFSTITLYDGDQVIATGTADASGAWVFAANVAPADDDHDHHDHGDEDFDISEDQTPAPIGSADAQADAGDAGAWIFTTAALTEGAHSFRATATDAAGNISTSSVAVNLVIDTLAPNAPAITSYTSDTGLPGDGVTAHDTLTLGGTAEANSTVRVYDGATVVGATTADANGVWSLTTATLANGGHSFTAVATDVAGNTSASSTPLSLVIDGVAPSAPAILAYTTDTGAAGDGLTRDNTLTLTGSAEANSTVQVYDGATLVGTATAGANGLWSLTTATLADGGHSFTALASDAAGNTSAASAALTMVIDSIAPNAPTITSHGSDTGLAGDGVTADNTLTLGGTVEANSTVEVFDGATLVGATTADANGLWSLTTATLADGGHSFTAIATDAAGNTSAASTPVALSIDSAAPTAPSISTYVMNDDGSERTVTLTGIAEPNSTLSLYDGDTLVGTATADASGGWSFVTAALADGGHSFTATSTDAAGNVSTASIALAVTIDSIAPVAPVITAYSTDTGTLGDGVTADNTLILGGTAEANSTVEVYDGATFVGATTADANGLWSLTTVALADGGHSFTAAVTDLAGNTSASSTPLSLVVDGVAPVAPTILSYATDSGVTGDGLTRDNTLTLSGSAEANSTVQVFDGATLIGEVTADANGGFSLTTAALADGSHSFTAVATDRAGNASAVSSSLTVMVDTAAPATPTITSQLAGITNDNTLTLAGLAEANAKVQIFVGATLLGETTADANGNFSFTTSALVDGLHSVTVAAVDAAGNASARSTSVEILVDTRPPAVPAIEAHHTETINAADGTTSGTRVTLNGAAEANSTVQVFMDAVLLGVVIADAAGAWNYVTGTLVDGEYDFSVVSTDAAGNVSTMSAPLNLAISTIVTPVANGETIIGDDADNYLQGGANNDQLIGAGGNDWLIGGLGADVMTGGSGNDLYFVDDAGDVVSELAADGVSDAGGYDEVQSSVSFSLGRNVERLTLTGAANINGTGNELNNWIYGNSGDNILSGGDGDDALFGVGGNDTLHGGRGNDWIRAGSGDDFLYGEEGDDYLAGAEGNDQLAGGLGNDHLTGEAGADDLRGEAGNDYLVGGDGNDLLSGGDGNDWLIGGAGADVMTGGSGNDIYFVDDAGDAVSELATDGVSDAGGNDEVYSSISFTLGQYVERLSLTGTANIDGTGNALNNWINGNSGTNLLSGGDGNDTLFAYAGDDALLGGTGNDWLNGGLGNDALYGEDGDDALVGAEGDDVLDGGAGNDWLNGGDGHDVLSGGAGNDFLDGGAGNDALNGSEGNDVLAGGVGDDVLNGGTGDNWLVGGDGVDSFVFSSGFGRDAIQDFQVGVDSLHFEAGLFSSFDDFLAHAKDGGGYVTVTASDSSTVMLYGVTALMLEQHESSVHLA